MKRLFALVLLAVGFASAAHADYIPATWTDSDPIAANGAHIGASGAYIGDRQSLTYTHDLSDNGFRPLTDFISSFHLSINLADDQRLDGPERAFVDLPGAFGDDNVYNFGLRGEEFGGWSVLGLLQLNLLGTLTVTISSVFGDFNLVSSTLTASGLSNTAATGVPEPGALGLLGVGLVGMALARRRKQTTRA